MLYDSYGLAVNAHENCVDQFPSFVSLSYIVVQGLQLKAKVCDVRKLEPHPACVLCKSSV